VAYWIRSANLQIGPFRYDLNGLEFGFECPFEDSDELGTATITVKNLSEQTRHSIQRNHVVILNAGYEGDVGLIFKGQVAGMSSKHSGTEWETEIFATEVTDEWLSKQVNKTYKRGMSSQDIVRDLCTIFGVEVRKMELAVDKTYPRGRKCCGKVHEVLRQIVTGDCKSRFLIRHGQITISDPKDPVHMGFLLAPHTGLLAETEEYEDPYVIENLTSKKDIEGKEESTKGKTCISLLNHAIGPGDAIMVQSRAMMGRFMAVRGMHKGSRSGDWQTHIEVKPI